VGGLLHEGDGIALRMAAEAVVIALAVIHMERRGFFLMERAGRPPVALGHVRLAHVPGDLPPDDGGKRDAGAQLVEESGGQRHGKDMGLCGARVESAGRRGRFAPRTPRGYLWTDETCECFHLSSNIPGVRGLAPAAARQKPIRSRVENQVIASTRSGQRSIVPPGKPRCGRPSIRSKPAERPAAASASSLPARVASATPWPE